MDTAAFYTELFGLPPAKRKTRYAKFELDERDTACCYARQDKVWVADPAGNRSEVYTVLADIDDEHAGGCC